MALSRLSCSRDFRTVLGRINHGVNTPLGSIQNRPLDLHQTDRTKLAHFHLSGVRRYPEAPTLPLPGNVSEIFGNETGRFTPERVRDIATPILLYGAHNDRKPWNSSWMSTSNYSFEDAHMNSYDCFGAISLNGAMQTNVPHPYSSTGKATHMNMPGGEWVQNGKYIAEHMQKSHYDYLRKDFFNSKFKGKSLVGIRPYSSTSATPTDSPNTPPNDNQNKKLTNAEKLKRAVKDYGSTVIVFHIGISLMSLGAFYALVSSGLDLTALVKLFTNSSERLETIMTGSSTFLIAYAVHKVFAPVRISITLGATPFIVRYLRRIGILKTPKT